MTIYQTYTDAVRAAVRYEQKYQSQEKLTPEWRAANLACDSAGWAVRITATAEQTGEEVFHGYL